MKISKVKATKAASKTTVKPPVTQRRDGTPSRKRSVAEAKTPAPLTVPWDKNLRNLLFGKRKGEIQESFNGIGLESRDWKIFLGGGDWMLVEKSAMDAMGKKFV